MTGSIDVGAQIQKVTKALAEVDAELAWEMAGTAADVAGMVDPTPASDLVGAGISLRNGDFLGAGLSVVGMVPYVGDALGKPAKAARAYKRIEALRERAASLTKELGDLQALQKKKALNEKLEVASAQKQSAGEKLSAESEKRNAKRANEKDCEDCKTPKESGSGAAQAGQGTEQRKSERSFADDRYGSIPPEHRARYDRYLAGAGEKALPPEKWFAKAKRAWENNSRGNDFEQEVRRELGAPLGAGSKPVSIEGYIPDLPIGADFGVTDIRNVIQLNNSDQLRASSKHAIDNGLPFNSIIGPRTESISEPLLESIRRTGGSVIRCDPATKEFTNLDIRASGPWKK